MPRRGGVVVFGCQLRKLDERQLHQQTLVAADAVVEVAVVAETDGTVEELLRASLCLLLIAAAHLGTHVEQGQGDRIAAHQHIAQMRSKSPDEVASIEASAEYLVEKQDAVRRLVFQKQVGEAEEIVVVEDVQVFDDALVGKVSSRVAHHLVEDGEGIAHSSVGLLGNHQESLFLSGYALLCSHIPQMFHHVADADAVEVIHLAAA